MIKYKFILQSSGGGAAYEAHPIYKADLSKEIAFEQNQMFKRENLSGQLEFVGDDYNWIMQQNFESKIYVTIQVDWQGTGSYVQYWRGGFYKTDCTIIPDDKKISVKPSVDDRYSKILAGLDKEYDLIKLAPAIQAVQYYRRPMLQIYCMGESTISNFMGGCYWEEDVTSSDYNYETLIGQMHFETLTQLTQIQIEYYIAELSSPFIGCTAHGDADGSWADFANGGTRYVMDYFQDMVSVGTGYQYYNGLRIYERSDVNRTNMLWEFMQVSGAGFAAIPSSFTFRAINATPATNLNATSVKANILGRWLSATNSHGEVVLPSEDIISPNRNYKYCIPCDNSEIVVSSNKMSEAPTEWGKGTNGLYFLQPTITDYDVYALYPIARTKWSYYSLWLKVTEYIYGEDARLRTPTTLKDGYTLEGVVKSLLHEIDDTIIFEGTSDYSTFLYGTNPLWSYWGRLIMTPKSNILVAEYQQPAQKAPIKLSDVFNMLAKACGCYWYIDDNKHLHIEHISYFKNGGSYSGTQAVGTDITRLKNPRNGKVWGFGQSEYNYDKIDMPARYEYAWMDDSTMPFKGMPIEVISTFVEESKIEEVNIGNFNADIDYLLLNPNNVSQDGFALMCCTLNNQGVYTLSFQDVTFGEDLWAGAQAYTVRLQNYQLAMCFLQPKFLISDMPSYRIKVNGAISSALGIQRKKKQTISIPVGTTDGNNDQLVKTSIGNGEVERATINLSSRMAKIQLRYDTV